MSIAQHLALTDNNSNSTTSNAIQDKTYNGHASIKWCDQTSKKQGNLSVRIRDGIADWTA
jgi:hypothetical protein